MEEKNLQKVIPILQQNDVEFAAVFGSYARGEATSESDIDLLVRFSKPKGFFAFGNLERKLSDTLKKKVDLVTEGALSPYIRSSVLKDLQVLYGER